MKVGSTEQGEKSIPQTRTDSEGPSLEMQLVEDLGKGSAFGTQMELGRCWSSFRRHHAPGSQLYTSFRGLVEMGLSQWAPITWGHAIASLVLGLSSLIFLLFSLHPHLTFKVGVYFKSSELLFKQIQAMDAIISRI